MKHVEYYTETQALPIIGSHFKRKKKIWKFYLKPSGHRKELLSLPSGPALPFQLPVLLWGCGVGTGIYSSVLKTPVPFPPGNLRKEWKGDAHISISVSILTHCSSVGESPGVKWAQNQGLEGDTGTHTERGLQQGVFPWPVMGQRSYPCKNLRINSCQLPSVRLVLVFAFDLNPKLTLNPLCLMRCKHISHQPHQERVPGYHLSIWVPQLLQPQCSLWINKLPELLGSIKR